MRFDKSELWHTELLSKYAKKITLKNKNNLIENIICNSAQNGLIQQKDFFDRTIVNNENTENYYVIEQGDFVYNPRKSVTAPYGPVNVYEYTNSGIVSPLYLCFKVDGIDKRFLNYYFKSSAWYKYIYENGDSGARHDRVSIKDDVFLAQPIIVPHLTTQDKIASFLSKIDQRIETQSKIIEKLQSQIIAISNIMVKAISQKISLGEICVFERKTAHQSSEGLSNGTYPFFTNEEETVKFFNSYDFNGEYIIANTGGKANFKYYNGKFAAMSDCLIIKIKDASLTKFYSIVFSNLQKYIDYVGFEGSGLKHLNKDWLLKLQVPQYGSEAETFIKIINNLKEKLQKEKDILSLYKKQKAYLLSNMFI